MTDSLTVDDALAIASTWITTSNLPFSSSFIGGSVAYAAPDSLYDPASDIDCYLVTDGEAPDGKIGKITVDGVLLDVSWLPWSQLEHAESDAVMASLLHFGQVVRDDGHLGSLQERLSAEFRSPSMVAIRLESMRRKIRNGLAGDSSHLQAPEQVMNWLFPATLATHIPLVKTCAPLTVRKRFLAAKKIMEPTDYEGLLALYEFDTVTMIQAQGWLDSIATLFDATKELAAKSSRFWATDIQAGARHIAIDGSQQLIDTGNHREALYWIIATSTRCLTVRSDADIDSSDFLPAFTEMLSVMGIETAKQRQERSAAILDWIEI